MIGLMYVHLNSLKFLIIIHTVKEGQAVTQNVMLELERLQRLKCEVIMNLEKAIGHVIVTEK